MGYSTVIKGEISFACGQEPWRRIHSIHRSTTSQETRIVRHFSYLQLAGIPRVPAAACAVEPADAVGARASVGARRRLALVVLQLALVARVACVVVRWVFSWECYLKAVWCKYTPCK